MNSTKPKPLEIVEPGGAIYLPYLVLHHTAWSTQKRMSTFLALAAYSLGNTGELGYDGPLYGGLLAMTDDMLGPSHMHIKYVSYVYDGFCI